MIVDSHCHVWERWPYDPPVPDAHSRARAEQLLFEMDRCGVEHAVIICAAIGDNPRNTDYAFEAALRHPGRFTVFPDLECRWMPEFRAPGAAERLSSALERWDFVGFTLYPPVDDDCCWFVEPEGQAFFALAAGHRLMASLSVLPHQIPIVARVARRFPELTILCHHYAHLGVRTAGNGGLAALIAAAEHPNIVIKVSGAGNVAGPEDEYPYARLGWIFESLRHAFGHNRLVWGSDYPVSRRHMTYAQTLALVARHAALTESERKAVLGQTMRDLLNRAAGGAHDE